MLFTTTFAPCGVEGRWLARRGNLSGATESKSCPSEEVKGMMQHIAKKETEGRVRVSKHYVDHSGTLRGRKGGKDGADRARKYRLCIT